MVRLLRVWFALLILLGSVVGSVGIGPIAALRGMAEESRSEWTIGANDTVEESASHWALASSKRSVLRAFAQPPLVARKQPASAIEPSAHATTKQAVTYRPLPRVLFRRSLPGDEEPPLTHV